MKMDRKLASIQRITGLHPIVFTNGEGQQETAGAIELADVLGWHCVVKKGEFKVGDPCVYFEVDSILPRTSWSEFLVDKNRPDKPLRVKTVKLKGQISQGLALPIAPLFGGSNLSVVGSLLPEDSDVTEILGVTKYEPPIIGQGEAKGYFTQHVPKTDEERLQTCFNKLKPFFGEPFYATEKVDGQSFTAYLVNGEFGVCSRNLELKEGDSEFWKLARELDLEHRMGLLKRNVAIQGEFAGPSIQGNKLKLKEKQLFLFNIYDVDDKEYYDYINLMSVAQIILELHTVPVIEVFNEGLPFENVDEAVAYATRKSVLCPDVWAEGVVFRPKSPIEVDRFGRLSFKVINPNFLLKHGE